MSKKLAAGADAILLDVKCGSGAFIRTIADAEDLARALVALGTSAKRETIAYITDMEQPLGRAVGNALEVNEAIETLVGHGPPELEMLSLRLAEELLQLARHSGGNLKGHILDGSALRKFAQLIEAQGGDPKVTQDPSLLPAAPVQRPVMGVKAGIVSRADALEIALAGKSLGAGRDRKDAPIDLAVGVVLQKKIGDRVEAGEPLAIIHARTEAAAASVSNRVAAAFTISAEAAPRPLLLRRVTASGIERLDT